MFKRIVLKNFKLFDETGIELEPGRITVLVGANGTGKSSVLQALILLKQSLGNSFLRTDGPLLNLGSWQDVTHRHEATRTISVQLATTYAGFATGGLLTPPWPSSGDFDYEAHFAASRIRVMRGVIRGGDANLETRWAEDQLILPPPVVLNLGNSVSTKIVPSDYVAEPARREGWNISGDAIPGLKQDAIDCWLSTLANQLRNTVVIPPVRGLDELAYQTMPEAPVQLAGDPHQQAQQTVSLLAYRPELGDQIAKPLSQILREGEVRLRTRHMDGNAIGLEAVSDGLSVKLPNEAFGLNQLAVALLWLQSIGGESLIGIEEPEIHLHPKAQAALCDYFVDLVEDGKRQLMLTTHSEHIVMGLLTAVAKGQLAPEDLAIYEFRREGDFARAERLDVNEHGQVRGGLRGFLEADLDEIGELIATRFPKVKP